MGSGTISTVFTYWNNINNLYGIRSMVWTKHVEDKKLPFLWNLPQPCPFGAGCDCHCRKLVWNWIQ